MAVGLVLFTAILVLKIMPSRGDVVTHEAGFEPVEDAPVPADAEAVAPVSP